MERLMTTEEVAELLRIDSVTVRRLIMRGELVAYRIAGEYRFRPADVENFIESQRVALDVRSKTQFGDGHEAAEEQEMAKQGEGEWMRLDEYIPPKMGYKSKDLVTYMYGRYHGLGNQYANKEHAKETPEHLRRFYRDGADVLYKAAEAMQAVKDLPERDTKPMTKAVKSLYVQMLETRKRVENSLTNAESQAEVEGYNNVVLVACAEIMGDLEQRWNWATESLRQPNTNNSIAYFGD